MLLTLILKFHVFSSRYCYDPICIINAIRTCKSALPITEMKTNKYVLRKEVTFIPIQGDIFCLFPRSGLSEAGHKQSQEPQHQRQTHQLSL